MARNGSGTYVLPAGNPVVTGTTISSTTTNNTFNDIATALTGSISKDGQTTPTGNLPMGGYAHTGVADATVRTMYGSAGQVQDSAFTFLTSPSGTNAMTATAALGMSAYVTGQRFTFIAPSTNTSACTLNINAIGAKAITKSGSNALAAGDIQSGAIIQVIYDGTQWQMVSPTLTVSSFSAGSTGLTPSSATTGAVTLAGTLAIANGGTGATTQAGALTNIVGYTPVQQGTGVGQLGNSVKIGWDGSTLLATVDATNLGSIIGVGGGGQSWQDVKSSRAIGTTYTNNTGKPIMVSVSITDTVANQIHYMFVGGVLVSQTYMGTNINSTAFPMSTIVPNGATYQVTTQSGGTITVWSELR